MLKTNALEAGIIALVFQNADFANVGDLGGLRGSATAGNLYLSLHTADPGEAGDQTSSEASYTGYARQAVPRNSGGTGWTRTISTMANAAAVLFPENSGSSQTQLWLGIGTASSGAGVLLYRIPLAAANPLAFVAATSDTISVPGSSFVVDDRVVFHALPGSTLPTGITEGTVYFVKTVSGTDITISATSGGATIDLTAAGAGLAQEVTPMVVTSGVAPYFAAGAIAVTEA